ncbi:MAG TPA: DUF1887 family CARF protein [Ktedonobacteraceae bacterium]|nr:DUF1887 family CARF protein [Ktedonobacteraceae bacterium]
MEKKKALMVVAGGRGVPDALALLYLKPGLVLPITSIEGWETETAFLDLAKRIPGCKVLPMEQIDAYDLDGAIVAIKDFREQCNKSHPTIEWDWIFTITSAPKILAFAAYEVAKGLGIPCWYIASQQEKVVSLVKEYEKVDTNRFFHLSFNDYIKIQGRTYRERKPFPGYRQSVQSWGDVAEAMARSEETSQLLPIFYRHRKRPGKSIDDAFRDPMFLPPEIETLPLVKWLLKRGMLNVGRTLPEGTPYRFSSKIAAQFMSTGDWLEVYVWDQINKTKGEGNGKPFADDCRWGCTIPKDEVEYELDVAVMYKAQLVIAECKTDEQPFRGDNNYLRILEAVADQLGGDYVSKVFITNCRKGGASYEAFYTQAQQLNIEVVTWERLPKIGEIMKQQAMHPKYPRK